MSEIIKGPEGYEAAMAEPNMWEARRVMFGTRDRWKPHVSDRYVAGWLSWPVWLLMEPSNEWRRKPLQPVEAVKQDEPDVTMAAEIAMLKSCLVTQCGIAQAVREQLRYALASRKAAEAALEAERTHGCWLRNALEMCAKYFGSASVDDLRQHIAKTLRDIDKTAGKESG